MEKHKIITNVFSPLPLGSVRGNETLRCEKPDWDALGFTLYAKKMEELIYAAAVSADRDVRGTALAALQALYAAQREDGSFGPENEPALAPRFLVLRALLFAHGGLVGKDGIRFVLRYFRGLSEMEELDLSGEGAAVALEGAACALWLYEKTSYRFLVGVARKLEEGSLPWIEHFSSFLYTGDLKRMRAHITKDAPEHYLTLGLYNAMALKYGFVRHVLHPSNKNAQAPHTAWEALMREHGLVSGMFSCDDRLSGTSPNQGANIEAAKEAVISLGILGCFSGQARYFEAVENIYLNTILPAWHDGAGQAYFQPNQISCGAEEKDWYDRDVSANPCLKDAVRTALYAPTTFAVTSCPGGLAVQSYLPLRARVKVGEATVHVRVEGDYAARGTALCHVESDLDAITTLKLRVPSWAKDACALCDDVSYAPGADGYITIERSFAGGVEIRLRFGYEVRLVAGGRQSVAVFAGPLLMALPVAEEKFPLLDSGFGARAVGDWRFGIAVEEPLELFYDGGMPRVSVSVAKIDWRKNGGAARALPVLPDAHVNSIEQNTLVPASETLLRICQMPQIGLYE